MLYMYITICYIHVIYMLYTRYIHTYIYVIYMLYMYINYICVYIYYILPLACIVYTFKNLNEQVRRQLISSTSKE